MTERRRPPTGTGQATAEAMRMSYFFRKHQTSAKPIEVYYMARKRETPTPTVPALRLAIVIEAFKVGHLCRKTWKEGQQIYWEKGEQVLLTAEIDDFWNVVDITGVVLAKRVAGSRFRFV